MISAQALSDLDEQVGANWFRRRASLMQAVQITHSNPRRVADWILAQGGSVVGLSVVDTGPLNRRMLRISTTEELMDALVGWWVLMDVDRTISVMSDPVFAETYDRVGALAPSSS